MRSLLSTVASVATVVLVVSSTGWAQLPWEQVVGGSAPTAAGFGDTDNMFVVSSAELDGYLYAGTHNVVTGTEVWRSSDGTTWTRINSDGFGDPLSTTCYSMVPFNNKVYAGIWSSGNPGQPSTDSRVFRFDGGTTWAQVNADGFGDPANAELWAMMEYGGYLYVGVANHPSGAEMWRAPDGVSWLQVNANGFQDSNNAEIASMASFSGHLYAATRNDIDGLQVWRAANGTSWSEVTGNDGFDGADNFAAHAMAVFDGWLYATTFNLATGAEVWRTAVGTSWTRVVDAGFGDDNNFGSYAMVVHDGQLFVGTFNWSTGTEVWRTTSGTSWQQVNLDGFGNSDNYAVMTFSELYGTLYAGLRNDTGAEMWRLATVIFADGFESGGTERWTSTVP